MVDVCYTPDLLAALADVPPSAWLNTVQCIRGRIPFSEAFVNKLKTAVHPSGVLVLEKPDGRAIVSCTVEYSVNRHRVTTWLDAKGRALVKADEFLRDVETRFGLILDHEVEKVTVSSQPAGLCVSFVVSQWFEEGLDKVSIVLSPAASVELKSEIGAVSMIEETDTTSDVITSFFEDATSDEPWLVIVEPY